jgi:hypothetical protein
MGKKFFRIFYAKSSGNFIFLLSWGDRCSLGVWVGHNVFKVVKPFSFKQSPYALACYAARP